MAFKVFHHIRKKNKRIKKKKEFALKLDMSKAYNKVEWQFLEDMMRNLGFPERWVSLAMRRHD